MASKKTKTSSTEPTPDSSTGRRSKKAKQPAKAKAARTKLSALDAAAKVLQESGQPMNCQDMIAAMAAKGYWTSPAGKTPAATLYSAMTRETKTKGNQARFHKTARGLFVYQSPQAS